MSKTNNKQPTVNFEQKRKLLCNSVSYKLRNPKLTPKEREEFLEKFEKLIETLD